MRKNVSTEVEVKYDSRPDTYEHIHAVQALMQLCVENLLQRAHDHDRSKLVSPEVELFNEYTPKLKHLTYGSPEYKESLKLMGPALAHHYANNDHHPENTSEGIRGMSLLSLLEMMCDWMASSRRQNDGCPMKSCDKNQERFQYSDDLKAVFKNTVRELALLEKR